MCVSFFAPFILPSVLFIKDHHNHNTRFASNGLLKFPTNNTSIYGTKSYVTITITTWKFSFD